MSCVAPVKGMLFNIRHVARIDEIAKLPGFEDAGFEAAQAVQAETARFSQERPLKPTASPDMTGALSVQRAVGIDEEN